MGLVSIERVRLLVQGYGLNNFNLITQQLLDPLEPSLERNLLNRLAVRID